MQFNRSADEEDMAPLLENVQACRGHVASEHELRYAPVLTSRGRWHLALLLGVLIPVSCAVLISCGVFLSKFHQQWLGFQLDAANFHRTSSQYPNFLDAAGVLLPPVIHGVVPPERVKGGKVIVVGDIHGCLDELKDLLKKADFDPSHDLLIAAGDLVDKGPYSVEVLEELQEVGALAVRGNHDDAALAAYEDWFRQGLFKSHQPLPGNQLHSREGPFGFGKPSQTPSLNGWGSRKDSKPHQSPSSNDQGSLEPSKPVGGTRGPSRDRVPPELSKPGRDPRGPLRDRISQEQAKPDEGALQEDPLDSKRPWLKDISRDTARWLRQLPFSLYLPSHNVLVVHAGLVPEVEVERQYLSVLYQLREVKRVRGVWVPIQDKSCLGEGTPWAQVYDGDAHVIFGHDSRRGLQDELHATGIDTGCVNGGILTALVLPPPSQLQPNATFGRGPDQASFLPGAWIVQVPARQSYRDGSSDP
eukprot:jgi/Botrbrau1/14652/Bobra.0108s0013.1